VGHYADHKLVFAKTWEVGMRTKKDSLGMPLGVNNLSDRWLQPLIEKAGVKKIDIHGLRHTCATRLIERNVTAQDVARRLGHKDISITLRVYTHAFREHQKHVVSKMSDVLYGR
jgi:integrase